MFSYIIGPLPFCVPSAASGETGPDTAYPLELPNLEELCRWVWRVRTWRCEITGISNEFGSFADHTFDFANHEQTGAPLPDTPIDLITGYGINLEHTYTVLDNLGDPYEFRLRLQALLGAFHTTDPLRYWPHFYVELDLLLPESTPAEEIVLRGLGGTDPAGTLEVEGATAPLTTGFNGQLIDSWSGFITLTALEEWDYIG